MARAAVVHLGREPWIRIVDRTRCSGARNPEAVRWLGAMPDIREHLRSLNIWTTATTSVFGRLSVEPPANLSNTIFSGRSAVGAFTFFSSSVVVESDIGRYCSFASDVIVGEGDHPTTWLTTHPFPYKGLGHFAGLPELEAFRPTPGCEPHEPKATRIGNDVWIGRRAFIKPGVEIGDGAIVGAHAVVTHDVPPYAIVAGTPARLVRYRFDSHTVQRLLDVRWWRFHFAHLEGIAFNDVGRAIDQIERRIQSGSLEEYATDKLVFNEAASVRQLES
jgi:chloramphenicol O-acetyltransferase type B